MSDNQSIDAQIDEILDDLPNAWCDECEHPRCVSNKESTKRQIIFLIARVSSKAVEHTDEAIIEAKIDLISWCLSRTDMQELKDRWKELEEELEAINRKAKEISG